MKQEISFFHPAKFLGTWFGAGLSKIAPGTCGSIAALPFAWIIQTNLGDAALLIAGIIAFFVGWVVCNKYLPFVDAKDPKEIVIDEVSGQWILLSFFPPSIFNYLLGLIIFRFFDIIKPYPISLADEKINGGFGVMFDDLLAAIYPLLIFVIIYLLGFGEVVLNVLGNTN
ncbi:MAG: phosphatidylglycerophosphatase A [Pseudomonadota bacterium]